ncbi:unnamed protein product [Polarella glacialis]|uniref:Aminoglycoside phosphotransferase domain-containing protein n=1 Tax=Polarella glacialis TaxID=89957 RepID=A0A813JIJ0_POLGL|nr:unnamed protein product [Polarella glacialis]
MAESGTMRGTDEIQSYKAQVVAELQKKGMWAGVEPEGLELVMLKDGIGELKPPEDCGASAVVVKPRSDLTTILSCHLAWSEYGVAVPLLAHTADFTVEALAKRRDYDETPEGLLKEWVDNAGLTARLHRAPTTWFDGHCREVLQDYYPLLKEEPLNSALYAAVARGRSGGFSKEDLPQTNKLRELMAILPRPMGEHAERLVNVHGDLWDGNILHMPDGTAVLTDFEQSVVTSAVQDLVHVTHKPLMAAYLEAMTGDKPSEAEADRLLLEAKIAEHVHFFVIRSLFGYDDQPGNIDELIEHSRVFATFATKLREDAECAKKILDKGDSVDWRGAMESEMQS